MTDLIKDALDEKESEIINILSQTPYLTSIGTSLIRVRLLAP